jgi:hypothetical protein
MNVSIVITYSGVWGERRNREAKIGEYIEPDQV